MTFLPHPPVRTKVQMLRHTHLIRQEIPKAP